MLIALLFEIPYLLELMMSDNGEKANYIFQQIRSPHHYVLGSDNLYMLYHFVGWLILGFIGLKLLDIKVNLRTRLLGIYSGLFIPILIAVFFTSVIFVPFISKIFFFRLAPFSTLLAQILFVGGIFSGTVFKAKNTIIQKLCLITLIFIGSFLILQWYILRYGLFSSYSLFFTGIMLTLVIVSVENVKIKYIKNNFLNYLIGFLSIFLLIISLFFQFKHFSYVSFFYNNLPTIQERSLYNWVKNSDPTSKFLIPPGLGNFRLNAERAIIVDWKSTPYLPDELIEWYERIQDVSGEKNITSYLDVKKGYLNLDLQRLKFLKEKYSITHAVLLESQNSIKHNLPVIFNNEKYHVIDLQSLD